MATISDLPSASSANAGDQLPMRRGSSDYKIDAALLARLAASNQFEDTQIMPAVQSGVISLPNNTAGSIAFSAARSGLLLFTAGLSAVASGMVVFRVGSSLMCTILAQAGGAVIVATTNLILTGTTGTVGKLTISAHSDNKLYVENRTGSPFSLGYLVVATV